MPLNYSMKALAGDEYRVPIALPDDPVAAAWIRERMDRDGRFRVRPAVGCDAVVTVLSIPEFADLPVIVGDARTRFLAKLSPTDRACITLGQIRDAALAVAPDRDPAGSALKTSVSALGSARDLGYCVYWALGDALPPTRRREAMAQAGWPAPVEAMTS